MNLPSVADSVRPRRKCGRSFRIGLLLGAVALLLGADKQLTPRGGDPVAQLSRILDRPWDDKDPEAADRRREVQLLAQEVKNLGDLSRAMLLPWVNLSEDTVVQDVRGRLVDRYLRANRQMLRRGSIDQRIAAINLIAATVRGARTRDNEPLINTTAPGTEATPKTPRTITRPPPPGGGTTGVGTAGTTRQVSRENFRGLRERLRELAPELIELTRARDLGPRGGEVHAAAARALGELEADPAEVIPALEDLMRHGNAGARRSAVFALETMLRILLPTEQSMSGGGELTTAPLNSTALSHRASLERLETMRRMLGVLPRGLRDSDPDVRLYVARIYHRIAFALLSNPLLPAPIPSAEAVLDAKAIDFYRESFSITESLFAEVAPLQRAFNDQADIMAAGAGDSSTEVRTEMCHALENVAQSLAKLRRVEESLQGLKKRLEHVPRPAPRDKDDLPDDRTKDREDRPRKGNDDLPLAPGSGPRKEDRLPQPRRRSPGTTWNRSYPPSLQVAREWGATSALSPRADLPRRDEPLPAVPESVEEANACSASLGAPVAVPLSPASRPGPFRLVMQKDDDKPDLLPPPRPAPEPKASYRKDYIRAALERLRDPSIRVRLSALSILEGMGRDAEDAVPQLIPALSDCNRFVRWQTARIIGRLAPFDSREVVPALMRRLDEYEDSQTRLAACIALQQYARLEPESDRETAQAIPLLAHLLHFGELEFRLQVLETIKTIGAPAAERALPSVAWAVKIDKDGSVRAAAARLLGSFGRLSQPAVPTLRRAMKDDDPEVRRAASEAILAIESAPLEQ